LTACLDSWAVLAWLDGEQPAYDRIEKLLSDRPLMSWVNAVEVYSRVERDHGRSEADDVLGELRKAFELDLPGTALMIETARLKASTSIALGDCYAIATACAHNLTLLTGDPEILDRQMPCAVEDLRSKQA
jgi:PIN domain nuclease of toxin-antitoxin system